MTEPFIIRAALAGIGVALAAGILGCFVVWRRMAYFGDSLSHSALAGIPLGLLAGMNPDYGIFAVVIVFSFLLAVVFRGGAIAPDTVLGIIAHGSLAVGIVAISLSGVPVFHLHSTLFGDILTVGARDIVWIYVCAAVVIAALALNWDSLVLMTISDDLAKAEGVNTFRLGFLLMFLMAVVVAVSLRAVGVLLVTSMLIIPAAAGRMFARSPEMMAVLSCAVGVASVLAGIYGSLLYDTPSGPSIVTAAAVFFVILFAGSIMFERVFKKRRI
ncbi:MAG: hypothetical protein GKS04_02025 [Candidatus Mycalebacterium zealandia]|nr:MAG: hypothetical protein GKS04_02025 [Candidatus Mycalebacterium zealandia]